MFNLAKWLVVDFFLAGVLFVYFVVQLILVSGDNGHVGSVLLFVLGVVVLIKMVLRKVKKGLQVKS